ncbi:MAG: hypothetical protein WBO68_14475 [Pyrinomonadaceae bacterium]
MSASTAQQKRSYISLVICVLTCGLTIWSFYPGFMTPDSIANLTQGREGVFYDVNAPLMSYLMGIFDRIVAGPGLIFVIHNIVFWTACYFLWLSVADRSRWLGLCVILFGSTPGIMAQMTMVLKDVALATGLFASIALLYFAISKRSRIALLISPVFLFYAFAARLNAIAAIVPIAIWAGFVFVEVFGYKTSRLASAFVGIVYLATLWTGVYLVNTALTEGKTTFPFQQVYLYDLAAISVATNENLFPAYIAQDQDFSMNAVRERYNERSVNDLIYKDVPLEGDRPVLALTQDPENIADLKTAWTAALWANPITYMRHRFDIFAQLVGLKRSVSVPYWFHGFATSPTEFRGTENSGFLVLMKYFEAFRRPLMQTFFHRMFICLGICLFMLYKSVRIRLAGDWQFVFVLASSGLLYSMAYFPTTPSTEFRYLFWPAISSALAIIFGVYLIRTNKTERSSLLSKKISA